MMETVILLEAQVSPFAVIASLFMLITLAILLRYLMRVHAALLQRKQWRVGTFPMLGYFGLWRKHGRFSLVRRDEHGVIWLDDSKATNVEATCTGIIGLRDHKSVVLLGGLAKVLNAEGSTFEQLVEQLEYHIFVITFGSSGTMIQRTLQSAGLGIPCYKATTLDDAVNCARSIARSGDTIVLSPGCASFDEFRNFEVRTQRGGVSGTSIYSILIFPFR